VLTQGSARTRPLRGSAEEELEELEITIHQIGRLRARGELDRDIAERVDRAVDRRRWVLGGGPEPITEPVTVAELEALLGRSSRPEDLSPLHRRQAVACYRQLRPQERATLSAPAHLMLARLLRMAGLVALMAAMVMAFWAAKALQNIPPGVYWWGRAPTPVNPLQTFGVALFGKMNLLIFVMIWLFVPLAAADAISRERREGTLVLLYLTELRSSGIVVADLAKHVIVKVTATSGSSPAFGVSWAPDGSRIAFEDGGQIWTVRANGTVRVQLTRSGRNFTPAWSPDGKEIAFGSYDGLQVMAPDGSKQRTLDSGSEGRPTWSPDGQQIAFVRFNAGSDPNGSPTDKVFVMKSDGSGLRGPLGGGVGDYDPAWSPVLPS